MSSAKRHVVLPLDDAHGANLAMEVVGAKFNNGGKLIMRWNIEEVEAWLYSINFGDIAILFRKHAIDGAVLPKLNDQLLKEMGISIVGQRLQLLNEIVKIQAVARTEWRNTVVWASEEYRAGPCNNTLPFGFPFSCDSCIGLPKMYKVTNSKINILTMNKNCNTPCTGWCGFTMNSDNVDLTNIKDVDAAGSTAMFGDPPGSVVVTENDNRVTLLVLRSSECQKVTAILTNAKEEAIVIAGMQAMQMMRQ